MDVKRKRFLQLWYCQPRKMGCAQSVPVSSALPANVVHSFVFTPPYQVRNYLAEARGEPSEVGCCAYCGQ
jgi:hypothetical protein